jgi:hypothetical protein
MAQPKLYDARRRPLVRRGVIQRRYDISARTLDNWMRTRKIPYYKIGSMLFFSIEKCDAALERFQIKPTSP